MSAGSSRRLIALSDPTLLQALGALGADGLAHAAGLERLELDEAEV